MTSSKPRLLFFATLAAAVAGVAGCSTTVDGTPVAADSGVVATTQAGLDDIDTQDWDYGTENSTSSSPSTTVTGEDMDVFSLRVGDCLTNTVGTGTTSSTEVIACTEPHSGEIYASFDSTAATFPGTDGMNLEAQNGCVDRFAGFVGIPFEQSTLEMSFYLPTQDSWDLADDREVLCIVEDPSGMSSGSLRDSNR